MSTQIPSLLILIRPSGFGVNSQTFKSNKFQKNEDRSKADISSAAQREFDEFVIELSSKNIPLLVLDELAGHQIPDAVFPNNWISFQPDGTVVVYPMESVLRRKERRYDIIVRLEEEFGYSISRIIDFTCFEAQNLFLESTGSIVFDYQNKLGYICRSSRSSEKVVESLFRILGYDSIIFDSCDREGQAIYHTNVMMCIGDGFAIACLESIPEGEEKNCVLNTLKQNGHEIIEISLDQLYAFAGNMLQSENRDGDKYLIMSESARISLTDHQVTRISAYCNILTVSIPTIEKYGGGSVRCMIAGVMLPFKNTNN